VVPVYSSTRVLLTNIKRTRGCGCSGHPALPTPSSGAKDKINGSDAWRREVEDVCEIISTSLRGSDLSAVAQRAKSEATKQSILSFRRLMDCFAEPVIDRAFARTRWLAMTVWLFEM
jgi:hypothetical protein